MCASHGGDGGGVDGEGQRAVERIIRRFFRRHRELRDEFLESDELETPIMVLDDSGERLDPVAGIEIVDITDHLVGGRVDMTADNAATATITGKFGDLIFELPDEADGLLDAGLDGLTEREVFLAAQFAEPVVEAIEAKEKRVTHVAQVGEDDHVLHDTVKHVAMQHEVAALRGFQDVILDEAQAVELHRNEACKKIVVVAAEIHDLGVTLLHEGEDAADKARVARVH